MYQLNDKIEHLRLDQQNSIDLYSVENELEGIDFAKSDIVLDAGCGHGAITSEVLKHPFSKIIGVDGSQERIKHYQTKFKHKSHISAAVSDLEDLPFEGSTFDKIICRFVLHHLSNPHLVIKELKRVLKPGGKMVIIDSDGILFNIHNESYSFEKEFEILRKKLPMDLFVGRKLKSILKVHGLEEITSRHIPMHFSNSNLEKEREQYVSRFESLSDLLGDILGELPARQFTTKYLEALEQNETELFYNKFVTSGIKV